MDGFPLVSAVVRWIHVVSAIVAIGGTIALRVVVAPAADRALDEGARETLREAIRRRWAPVLHTAIGLLLLSGFYNFFDQGLAKGRDAPLYHPLFGVKFLLALTVFFIGIALTGRSELFAPLRARAHRWSSVAILLGLAVVLLSAVLRFLG